MYMYLHRYVCTYVCMYIGMFVHRYVCLYAGLGQRAGKSFPPLVAEQRAVSPSDQATAEHGRYC